MDKHPDEKCLKAFLFKQKFSQNIQLSKYLIITANWTGEPCKNLMKTQHENEKQ